MRKEQLINDNWLFRYHDGTETVLNIPHTWNAKDGQDGGNDYYRGTCVYEKNFPMPVFSTEERVYLQFDGVNASAKVILNGAAVMTHDGGYATFRCDITDHLKQENHLAVEVDNSVNDQVYPQKADFTFYGGIYRDVKLITVNQHHFDLDHFGGPGIAVHAEVNGKDASVWVRTWHNTENGTVSIVLKDAAGNVVRTDTGSNLRPDVILHIDNNREIIIDSKVSLTAFMDYVNAETEDERQRHLKAHIESIQKHVKELSKKDYSSYIKAPKVRMDYVIMFVPHTGALWTALNTQPDLWRKAMEMNVFIADEQTLFAALRMVNLTWTHIAQTENHKKVYELANEIIERVGMFMESYESIGKAIANAQRAYDDGGKKLAPSGQSILNSCAKLNRLGAKQSSKHPIKQIEGAADSE